MLQCANKNLYRNVLQYIETVWTKITHVHPLKKSTKATFVPFNVWDIMFKCNFEVTYLSSLQLTEKTTLLNEKFPLCSKSLYVMWNWGHKLNCFITAFDKAARVRSGRVVSLEQVLFRYTHKMPFSAPASRYQINVCFLGLLLDELLWSRLTKHYVPAKITKCSNSLFKLHA